MDVIEVKASESYKTAHYLPLEPQGLPSLGPGRVTLSFPLSVHAGPLWSLLRLLKRGLCLENPLSTEPRA